MHSTDFTALHIPIASVTQGERHFEFRVSSFINVREGACFPDGVAVDVDVQIIGEDFLADLKIGSTGAFVCDRCGKTFHKAVKGHVRTFFTYGKNLEAEEENDDIKRLQPSDRVLDITRDAADALILSVPTKILCDDNCKGLCQACGADLNSETCSCPREANPSPWDALKKIHFD